MRPEAEPSVLYASLLARCPHCGKGRLFRGYLRVAPGCSVCGLSYAAFQAGDGPAVFVILIVGAIVAGGALITEVKFQPPYWVHAALWLPLIALTTLGPLRPIKGIMIALQYHHKAAEGRLSGSE